MTSDGEAGVESLQQQWEVAERIRGGWLLDSKRLRKAALVEYRCSRNNDLLAALVKVEGTLYFMWQQHRKIAVVDSGNLQDWGAGKVADGVSTDAAEHAVEAVKRWLDAPEVPAPGYRPESLKESAQLTPEPVPGRWECERFTDWPDSRPIHANCAHNPLAAQKRRVVEDARRLRRARSKRVIVSL